MREMKDSGIEWIDKIPLDWTVKPLKWMVKFGKGLPITKENLIEQGVPVVSYGQIHSKTNNGTHLQDNLIRFVSETYLESNPLSLGKKGDIFFADTSEDYAGIGNAVLVDIDTHVFAGYHTVIVRPNDQSYSRYLAYLFLTDAWRSQLCSMASGIKVFSITQGLLKKTTVILPPVEKVAAMTEYLDRRCSQIDAIIARQQEVIEKLKAYKLSVITEAVTKGLNPNVPMKDSGIEWIGKMPADWNLLPFRRVLFERTEKNSPIRSTERLSLSIDKGVTLYADKTTNLDRFKDDFSQYKLAYEGDLVMNSMNMIVGASGVSSYFGCVSPAYYTFYDMESDHVTAKYCEYIFRSKSVQRVLFSLGKGIYAIERGDDRVNTCRLKVSREDLKKLRLPVPFVDEQRKIVQYLDAKSEAIDNSISQKQEIIDKLIAYKQSLIYEVVTGKKEV